MAYTPNNSTIIINVVNESGFTQVPNKTIRDMRLKLEHRGLLVYLLSHSNSYEIKHETIAAACGISVPTSQKYCAALKKAGYLTITKRRVSGGVYRGCVWTVYGTSTIPVTPPNPASTAPRSKQGSVEPSLGEGGLVLVDNFQKNTNEEKNKRESAEFSSSDSNTETDPGKGTETPNTVILDADTKRTQERLGEEAASPNRQAPAAKKGKEIVTPEQEAIRERIKVFLAKKCYYAMNLDEYEFLLENQKDQLKKEAERLQKRGVTAEQLPGWLAWFVITDYRGKNYKANPGSIFEPSIVSATWGGYASTLTTKTARPYRNAEGIGYA